jgi:hypothetical protein
MIPDLYVDIFKDVLESKDYSQDLLDLSVDILEIHGKTYTLRGNLFSEDIIRDRNYDVEHLKSKLK